MTLSWPIVTFPMIVTEFSNRVPLRIRAWGPITVNGPISTSSSISAVESIDAVSAMRAAITDFSNYCQRLGQDEFVASRQSFYKSHAELLRTTPLRHCFKSLIRNGNLLQQPLGQLRIELMSTPIGHDVTDNLATGKSQVANHIQQFVPDTLVGKSQRISNGAVG